MKNASGLNFDVNFIEYLNNDFEDDACYFLTNFIAHFQISKITHES